jgi:hypothetical protein
VGGVIYTPLFFHSLSRLYTPDVLRSVWKKSKSTPTLTLVVECEGQGRWPTLVWKEAGKKSEYNL